MYSTDKSTRMIGLAVTTAMAGVLLSGCAASVAPRADVSVMEAQEAMAQGRHERAIDHAEAAVLAEPRNASYRAVLGQSYLDAGRFASAETSFNDAMALGDNSPRTALSLALALTAQAKYSEAAALLNDWEGQIATADLGLALALAGQPQRGIHLMTNGIRGGENTVKMRQNLAYAYALAGRWRDARIMVSQDVPADQVGERMARWGEMVHPAAYQHRVAGLLGVPAGARDNGQPVQLALANHPAVEQLAAEASAYVAAADADQVDVAELDGIELAQADTSTAMPGEVTPVSDAGAPAGQPQIAVNSYRSPSTERPTEVSQAFATEAPAGGSMAQVAQDTMRFVSEPVVQTLPVRYGAAPQPRVAGRVSEGTRPIAQRAIPGGAAAQNATITSSSEVGQRQADSMARLAASPAGGTHLVQLGSFASEQGARRAWGIYVSSYPQLAEHQMVISEAIVRGKRYYRVSAAGFSREDSRSMCASRNANAGEGCIAWAEGSPLPGAIETDIQLARR